MYRLLTENETLEYDDLLVYDTGDVDAVLISELVGIQVKDLYSWINSGEDRNILGYIVAVLRETGEPEYILLDESEALSFTSDLLVYSNGDLLHPSQPYATSYPEWINNINPNNDELFHDLYAKGLVIVAVVRLAR